MLMKYQFNFENSGQGLFYNGKIDQFNIVYDCGSENYIQLKDCIEKYKNTWDSKRGNKLDLLILSHFHDDHINGLNYLLENTKLGTVVFPYMDPVEKLYLLNKEKLISPQNRKLLINPVDYFIQKGAEKIILIKKSESEQNDPNPDIINHPDLNINNINTNDIESDLHFNHNERDRNLENNIIANHPELQNKVFVLEGTSHIYLKNIWKFLFFNLKRDTNQLKKFKAAIDEVQCNFSVNFNNPYELQECLKDKEIIKELADCYTKFKGNYNYTSLCCYHGPNTISLNLGCITMVSKDTYGYRYFKTVFREIFDQPINTLLTGDISIQGNRWKQFKEHYKQQLDEVLVTLIPHHGSKHNWNRKIIDTNKICQYWVTSSGFSNKYNHPSIDVVKNLIEEDKDVFNCNEFSRVIIRGVF